MDISELTKALKHLAMEKGAVLVGVAPVERFDPMPQFTTQSPRVSIPGISSRRLAL